ncbi:MAG: nicotinate (nicotinamide) nucleotide adenylyltransferase [Melioribacteraceae bacterium]|nr:nicotinate (nicotinamide) nucleotide adenylyltransferase [Melioribacteraceae bacterium]
MLGSIGIFGGTFDPVHFGHLITAQSLFEQRNLGKIIFIPCNISPHKTDRYSCDSKHRVEMLRLALEKHPHFEIDDYEIKKGDVSFSLDTIVHLSKIYSDLELIIGYDNLLVFDKWFKPDEILSLAKLVVMKRISDEQTSARNKYFDYAEIVNTPTIEISSTTIRERVKENKPVDFMVPESVEKYIRENGIYR